MMLPAIFFVVIILLALVRPYLGLLGLISSMLIRFQDRYEAIAAIPTFQLMAVSLIVGMVLHRDQLNSPKLKIDRQIAWFSGYAFFGLMIMNRSQAIEQMIGLMSSILVYYLVTRLVTSRRQLIGLLLTVIAVTVGLAAESLMSYYNDFESPFANIVTGRLQGLGYYANANEFGKLMCTAIPFAAIFLVRGNILVRLAALASIAVMVLVIGETLSRTCFVVLGITIGVAIMLRGSGQMLRKAIVAAAVSIAMIYAVAFLPGPLQERASSIVEYSTDSSFQGRVRAWDQGFQMVSWYPIFGVGKGQWYDYHGRAPHNSYVQVLAETGIPGFLIFMSIIWISFRDLVTHLRKKVGEHPISMHLLGLAIASSYAGYLFYIFLGNQGYSPWTYFYFGISGVFAFLCSEAQATDAANEQPESEQRDTVSEEQPST